MRRVMEAATTRSPQSNAAAQHPSLFSDFPLQVFSFLGEPCTPPLGMGIHSVENERLFSFSRRAVQQVPLHLWACARDRVEFLAIPQTTNVQIRNRKKGAGKIVQGCSGGMDSPR